MNIDIAGEARTATGTADASGHFSIPVTVPAGTVTLTVVATAPNGATGYAQRTVVYDVVPGHPRVQHDRPHRGRQRTGDLRSYPTPADVFHPGAFDLQKFEVYDSGTDTVTFRVQTADLSPTFGSPLGAQLVDVYVKNPAGGPTSTAASYPGRNYTITADSAWNRLIEVQGFGQRFIDGTGATVGSVSIRASSVTRYITFTVTKSALGGTPAQRVDLLASSSPVRTASAPTRPAGSSRPRRTTSSASAAPGGTSPICSVNPGTVPKAVDVLTPAGVSQADELDPTKPPVEIQGVTIP